MGGGERLAMLLLATLNDARADGATSRHAALLQLMKRSKKEKMRAADARGGGGRDPADEAAEILDTLVLSHVPCEGFDFGPKVAYIATMLRRMLLALADGSALDDRDYYGNKRLDLAGASVVSADVGQALENSIVVDVAVAVGSA